MLKRISMPLWAIIAFLVFIISTIIALRLQQQITQSEAAFPPASPNIPLASDNGFGVTMDMTQYDPEALQQALDGMQAVKFAWIRQPFQWSEIQPEPDQFDWQAYDQAIEMATLRGFNIIAVLETSPVWARPDNTPATTPPNEVTEFGRFAHLIAQRYGDKIRHYQIWHEPNLSQNWGERHASPAEYTHLLKNAAIQIRQANPQAKILTAALAPTLESGPLNLNEMDFLNGMYQAKAAPWFDIVAAQLYGFHLPIEPIVKDRNTLSIGRVLFLRDVMQWNNDADKPIWGTAFGWHTLPGNWQGQPTTWPSDSPKVQRQRTQEALTYMRANWTWLGPVLSPRWDNVGLDADDPAQGFAINPELITPFKVAQYKINNVATIGHYLPTHPSGQYSPGWQHADQLVDIPLPTDTDEPAKLTIQFEGTRLDLKVNRGLYRGYLRVQIDGQPSQTLPIDEAGRSYVVLYDPLRESETVTIARNLTDELHEVVIESEGGWGQWAIGGWAVHREANTVTAGQRWGIAIAAAIISGGALLWQIALKTTVIWSNLLLLWQWMTTQYSRVDRRIQLLAPTVFGLGFYLVPSPLDLVFLLLTGLGILLRLESGLILISFAISYFLGRKSLPIGAVPLLEFGLLIVVFAVVTRVILQLGQDRSRFVRANFKLRSMDWAALLFILIGLIATLNAFNFGVSNFELRTVIIGSIVFYFLMRFIPWLEQSDIRSLVLLMTDAFIAGATLHAATALYQYGFSPEQTISAEGVRRALGYFYGSPNNLSLFLDRALPISFALCLFGVGYRRRLGHAVALIILSVALFLTYSKGALLIAVPGSLIFVALLRGGRLAWLGSGSGLILLGVALIPIARTERFQSTFSLAPGSTTFFRLRVWQSAWEMLKDFPLTGVGLDNFLYQYRTRYILPSAWEEPNLSHPHNLFLDFATRMGVGGLLILIWLLFLFWVSAFRVYRQVTEPNLQVLVVGLMGSMMAFFLHGLIDNSYFLVDLAYTFFLTVGLIEMIKSDLAQPISDSHS
ncbi:MAG: O-antigen ligase family protein [Chloroflexota bacterium]